MTTADGDVDEAGETGATPRVDDEGRHAAYQQAAGETWFNRLTALEATGRAVSDSLFAGEDPAVEDVEQLRQELAEAHRLLEDVLAPAAGLEAWGGRLPAIPYGVAREHFLDDEDDEEAEPEVVAEE